MSILKRVFPAVCAFIPLVTFWYFFGLPIEEVFQHTNLAFSKMTIVGIIFGVILFTIGIFARVPLSMHALYLLCVYLVYSTQNMAYAKCAGLLPFLVAYLNIITKESNFILKKDKKIKGDGSFVYSKNCYIATKKFLPGNYNFGSITTHWVMVVGFDKPSEKFNLFHAQAVGKPWNLRIEYRERTLATLRQQGYTDFKFLCSTDDLLLENFKQKYNGKFITIKELKLQTCQDFVEYLAYFLTNGDTKTYMTSFLRPKLCHVIIYFCLFLSLLNIPYFRDFDTIFGAYLVLDYVGYTPTLRRSYRQIPKIIVGTVIVFVLYAVDCFCLLTLMEYDYSLFISFMVLSIGVYILKRIILRWYNIPYYININSHATPENQT